MFVPRTPPVRQTSKSPELVQETPCYKCFVKDKQIENLKRELQEIGTEESAAFRNIYNRSLVTINGLREEMDIMKLARAEQERRYDELVKKYEMALGFE